MLGQFHQAVGKGVDITFKGISVWDALLFEALVAAATIEAKEEIIEVWKKKSEHARAQGFSGFAENTHRRLMKKEFEKILAKGDANGADKGHVTVHH